jgi:hypothetical protein
VKPGCPVIWGCSDLGHAKSNPVKAADEGGENLPLSLQYPAHCADPIRSDPIRSDPIRSDPIRSDPIKDEKSVA